jgi:AmmeMemoRadiSam system protein A
MKLNENLTKEEQEFLLSLARETLELYLSQGKLPNIDITKITPRLEKVQGCFVTLTTHGNLRGCIGHILPQEELWKCVRDNTISAALYDPRFKPVSYDELKDIEIEISVLSVPKKLEFSSTQDLLNKLRPNIDGVVIKYKGRQSTYLPQVWEQLPNKEQFLSQLCLKQGSPPNCWTKEDVEIYTYQAFVFGE